jgi:hypothetical protein
MKKIALQDLPPNNKDGEYKRNNLHQVFTGNTHREYFTNKKTAKKYIVTAEKFINNKLQQINYLYGEIFLEYRRIWIQIDNQDFLRILERDFNSINTIFNQTVDYDIETNYHAFNNFNKILSTLKEIILRIIKFLKRKKHYPDSHRLTLYISIIDVCVLELERFPEPIE